MNIKNEFNLSEKEVQSIIRGNVVHLIHNEKVYGCITVISQKKDAVLSISYDSHLSNFSEEERREIESIVIDFLDVATFSVTERVVCLSCKKRPDDEFETIKKYISEFFGQLKIILGSIVKKREVKE